MPFTICSWFLKICYLRKQYCWHWKTGLDFGLEFCAPGLCGGIWRYGRSACAGQGFPVDSPLRQLPPLRAYGSGTKDRTNGQRPGMCLQRGACRRHSREPWAVRTPLPEELQVGGAEGREGCPHPGTFAPGLQLRLTAVLWQVLAPPSLEPEGAQLVSKETWELEAVTDKNSKT